MLNITEIRIRLVARPSDKLRAFVELTIADALAVKDIKVIEKSGRLFVAMPSRKLAERCSHCGDKNDICARYCNACGTRLPDCAGPQYADIVHPISPAARSFLEAAIFAAYERELKAEKESPVRSGGMNHGQ